MFLATFDNLEHASFELPLEKAAFAPASPIVCGVLFPRVRVSKTLILIVRAPKIKVSRRQQKVGENIVMERLEGDEGPAEHTCFECSTIRLNNNNNCL